MLTLIKINKVDILISHRTDFRARMVIRDEEKLHTMIKGLIL